MAETTYFHLIMVNIASLLDSNISIQGVYEGPWSIGLIDWFVEDFRKLR